VSIRNGGGGLLEISETMMLLSTKGCALFDYEHVGRVIVENSALGIVVHCDIMRGEEFNSLGSHSPWHDIA
jgi:hypothetical protein